MSDEYDDENKEKDYEGSSDDLNAQGKEPADITDESAEVREPDMHEDKTYADGIPQEQADIKSRRRRGKRGGKRREKKQKGTVFFMSVFIFLIGLVSAGIYAYDKYMPNFEVVPLHKFYSQMDSEKIYIIIGDQRIETKNFPVKRDGEVYIPVDFVKEYIDKYIFWDESTGRLTITTENKVIQMRTEELSYYINDKPFNINIPVYDIDGIAYMPVSMITDLYEITIAYDENYNMTVIDYLSEEKTIYKVTSDNAAVRYEADIKSPIEDKLALGSKVVYFGGEDGFSKIRTEKGLIGYINTKNIEFEETIAPVTKKDTKVIDKKPLAKGGKINIVWDQIEKAEASANEERRTVHKAIDVISPTWFLFDAEKLNGDIINKADKGYVEWAHKNGYQVWALITDNFNEAVSHAILSDTNLREYAIKQILTFVAMYDLDGINIDFENVKKQDSGYYIQFLRELFPLLNEQGVILSVDMYVPKPYNMYYNRMEVAKASDYIIIMGYDENGSWSEASGPVASIGFVEEGIFETLKEVPKEQVILGMPYYMRVWWETGEGEQFELSSKAYSRDGAYALFKENGAEFEWLETLGCYYAQFTTTTDIGDGEKEYTYKVWMEEERSLEEKLKLVKKYDLAGVSGWSANWFKGTEKDDFLNLVDRYMK